MLKIWKADVRQLETLNNRVEALKTKRAELKQSERLETLNV
jgi:hypothetical protein